MKRSRRQFSGTEKVAVLRRHLIDSVPISDICSEYELQPTVFYRWQKQFFENGAAAFDTPASQPRKSPDAARIVALEQKLLRKHETLSELMEEHVQLKKVTWGRLNGLWVLPTTRDEIVGFVDKWSAKSEIAAGRLLRWIGLGKSKFHAWRHRQGLGEPP
jgi:transposase-like protein